MKSFLKQVLAILVALTIFGIGGCVFFAFAFHSTVNEFRAKQQADEEAERERIRQYNLDFAAEQKQLIDEYNERVAKKRQQN